MKHLICDECGGAETRTVRITKRHYRRKRIFKVPNVEAEECPVCGARSIQAREIHRIDCLLDKELEADENKVV